MVRNKFSHREHLLGDRSRTQTEVASANHNAGFQLVDLPALCHPSDLVPEVPSVSDPHISISRN